MTIAVGNDGVKLAYDAMGEGDPPIVFVHGWSCDRSYFAPQFEHFAGKHAVAALDLRGSGESEQPDALADPSAYSIEKFADDVLAVSAALGYERPVVIGHSMGGLVALEVAARPGAARAAILVDPAPMLRSPEVVSAIETFGGVVAGDADGSQRRNFVTGMFLPTDAVRKQQIIDEMPAVPAAVAAAAIRAIAAYDSEAALRECKVPLLSIGSAVPSNPAQALRELNPTIVIGQTVGSGHFNQLEVPDQANAMIERFLATSL